MHTYASLADLKAWMVSNGATDYGTTDDAALLTILEGASRRVEGFCQRSANGSGFGPRTGTNRYDGTGGNVLMLDDDLLSLTTCKVYASTASATYQTAVAETDYFLFPYDTLPKRRVILHGQSSAISVFTYGRRTVELIGSWGYSDERVTCTATASAIATTSGTSVTVSSGAEFAVGQTLLIDSEQMYVTAVVSTTLTVVRGANGTTAATHGAASAVALYRYPREVVDATLRIAHRRWRAKEAGLTMDFGGGGVPTAPYRDPTENSILNASVGHLRLYSI